MAVSLIVTDGGVLGLLAVATAAERSNPNTLAIYWHPAASPERTEREAAACHNHEKLFGISPAPEHIANDWRSGLDEFELTCRTLLDAALLVRRLGGGEVVWPVNAPDAAAGDGPDVDAISRAVNQSLLVSELVSITAPPLRAGEEVARVRIRAPYSDLTDRQIADLILDMDLPIWTCWFWNAEGDQAGREKARWMAQLRAAGWMGSFDGNEPLQVVTRPRDVKASAAQDKGEHR